MAKRTVATGYFGSLGMGDPMSSFVERTLRVAWDFSKKNVPQNTTIPLLPIPKGFCIDRISVVQTAKTNAPLTLTFGMESDDSVVAGGNFALVSDGALLRSSQAAKAVTQPTIALSGTVNTSTGAVTGVTATASGGNGPDALFVSDDDMLCMVMPTTMIANWAASTAYAKGALVKVAQGTTPETYKVYASKSARTSGSGTFDDTEKANWDEVDVGSATSAVAGAFDLCIHGFEAFSEAYGAPTGTTNYRQTLQTTDNVGGERFPID